MTSPHRTAHTPRIRRMALVSMSVTVAAVLSGCSADADESSGTDGDSQSQAAARPKGVVTLDVARATVDEYEKVNNKANAVRDGKLLGTVEAGQVHEQSLADYKQFKTWSKADQKEYGTPFFYKSREYYIPDGDQSWFAVKATSSGTKYEALMIFDKVDGRFKLVSAVYAEETTTIPKVAVRNGFATAVDPSNRVGPLAPDQLGNAFEDLVETGGKKEGQQLAPTQATKEFTKHYTDRTKAKEASFATINYFDGDPAHPKVYALRLADGGVLAVFPSAYTNEFLHKRFMNGGVIIPGERKSLYNPERRPVITDVYQGQGLAILTPSEKPKVIAREFQMVDSQ
ncbi:hypothetical protein ACFPH6_32720 [Streptomyces xiangluensis]|uniref:DUF8094 domain-containing protein n=1 Tax=Streptomyces xiangluensis TaxID=2665720 RepID=A0ABV8YVD3_9ACTN